MSFRSLRKETLGIIQKEVKTLADEYYENYIDGISVNIEKYVSSIFDEIHLLSGITQIYFTHRNEFGELSEQLNQLDYFKDRLRTGEEWVDNSPDEPTEIFVPRYLLNDDLSMNNDIRSLVDDTRFLDLILPVFASSGINKIQVFYQGGQNSEIFRMAPWFGIGENIYAVYPEMNKLPIWDTFNPGLAEQWEEKIRNSGGDMKIINGLMRVTPPVQDGLTGEIVLTISQPIAGNDFTSFEGTISYDIPIDSVIDFVEKIRFSDTGFAFLTQSNGNIFGINDYGLEILGLSGDSDSTVNEGEGFNSLQRFLKNSIYEDVKQIELISSDVSHIQTIKINQKEYFLVLKKLEGYQSWHIDRGFFQENWNLGFIVPKEEVFKALSETEDKINEQMNSMSSKSFLISILISLLLVGILYLLINRIIKRLHRLVYAVNEIKLKNYDIELKKDSIDEVGQLSDAFNGMIKEIKNSFTKLSSEVDERKKSEQKYITLMEAVPDPVLVYNTEGEVIYINPAFCEKFGWSLKELEEDLSCFIPVEYAVEADESEGVTHYDSKRRTRKGELLDVSINGSRYYDNEGRVIGTVYNLRDITKWKRAQELMIQSEKMMSFSSLAASMAHDVKNPLAGIVQNAQIISNRIFGENQKNLEMAEKHGIPRDKLNLYMEDRGIPKMIEAIVESVKQANQRIDHMLSFNISKETKFRPVDMVELMEKTISLEDYNLKRITDFRKIDIKRYYGENLRQIVCDRSKIQQVFFNIIKNSAEAIESAGIESPVLSLKIEDEGDYQIIEIEDNGPGMNDRVLSKIFEPFYSTKSRTRGKGLGLSVSYFIVEENHKGTLTVESEEGKWTRFTIKLPVGSL